MSSPLNLEQIYLLACERADMLADDAGTAIPTPFINEGSLLYFVNVELASLWDHLIMSNEEYASKRYKFSVIQNVEEYVMPDDFYKLRKVFPIDSYGNRGNAMKKFQLDELGRDDLYNIIHTSGLCDARYRLMGKRLFIYPIPTASSIYTNIEVWYYHDYPHIENYKDLLPHHYPAGWEDYVVEGIAARLKEKVDEDSSPFKARQKEVLTRILSIVQERDYSEPHQMIHDDSGEYYY